MSKLIFISLIILCACGNTGGRWTPERTETYKVTYQNGNTENVTITYSRWNCRLEDGDFKCGYCGGGYFCVVRSYVRSIQKLQ